MVDIVVCGCSFSTAEKEPRDHYSQILVDKHNLSITNLARSGISNVGIAFQLQQALSLQPTAVVFNRTFPDRTEIILHPDNNFDSTVSLDNFCYPYPQHENYTKVGDPNGYIFSTVWQGLEDMPQPELLPEQICAIELWVKHLFDWNLKKTTDDWLVDYWVRNLSDAGIQVIELTTDNFAKPIFDYAKKYNPSTVFHTDRATQEELAKNLFEIFANIGNKS